MATRGDIDWYREQRATILPEGKPGTPQRVTRKYIAIIIILFFGSLLFSFSICHAQDGAKILFYRDKGILPLGSVLDGERIFFNGKKIFRIRYHDIYIYRSNQDGKYSMVPQKKKRFTMINSEPNTIAFVALKLKYRILFYKADVKQVSLFDFKKIYNSKKWLRKKMAKDGYYSVEELIKGLKVNDPVPNVSLGTHNTQ